MNFVLRRMTIFALLASLVVGGLSCESLTWRTAAATGIGCAAGLGIGAIIDEYKKKEDSRQRRDDIFGIFRKKKQRNDGKMVGLATGCLAGLGVGLYLDLMYEDMSDQFKDRGIELEKVKAPNGDTEELKVNMDGDISFDTGSAELAGSAENNVDTLAEALQKYPETAVRVWGHTDGTGSRAVNDRLSRARASEVADELEVGSSRVAEIKGWANDKPLPGTSKTGNVRENRRVEVYILPKE